MGNPVMVIGLIHNVFVNKIYSEKKVISKFVEISHSCRLMQ